MPTSKQAGSKKTAGLQHLATLADDSYLKPYACILQRRKERRMLMAKLLQGSETMLAQAMNRFETYGLHRNASGDWVFREWAPHAEKIYLVGDHSGWQETERFRLHPLPGASGGWELRLPADTLRHRMHYELHLYWPGGSGKRLPACAERITQDPQTLIFTAEVYDPPQPYVFRFSSPAKPDALLIYEAHTGMAQEEGKIGSFREFSEKVLPRIARSGYNTVQLMAVMSHPYYGSFGYHVANFFAVSGQFGTPDEFKELVDHAHELGLRIIMDIVHSHAVRNEIEGLGRFDGTREQYFYPGSRGEHAAWDSLCFNYEKKEVLEFLLSNCRYWLEEYHIDGFRFDGVTSMLYDHHGLNHVFGSYDEYFSGHVDEAAYTYLALANQVIHEVRPDADTVAEDVSGMPGLAAPLSEGGAGFDYRMAMGTSDYWFKLFDVPDENWSISGLYWELTNRRRDERTVSYVECHDQALVGGQTAIFRLGGSDLYTHMSHLAPSDAVLRAIAIHKMARLVTAASAGYGYLNFMGNEFGHPEWIDFPREGNNWSYHYARRQWHLADDPLLYYHDLGVFDQVMIEVLKAHNVWKFEVHKLKVDDGDKILAMERGNLWFFCNFHPTKSFENYGIEVMPGRYELIFHSDEARFGGMGRLAMPQTFFTIPVQSGNLLRHELKLYLPTRTALVLKKVD